jgi:hypothetical protein
MEERDRRKKRRFERLDAYEEFAALTMAVALGETPHVSDELLRSLHRVEIRFSPATGKLAFLAYSASLNTLRETQNAEGIKGKQEVDSHAEQKLNETRNEWGKARDKFIKSAREEISSSENLTATIPNKGLN